MPKLLVFAPCEKSIIGQDNVSSLISIIEYVIIELGEDLPLDERLPIQWSTFSLWQREANEVGKNFEQRVEVIRPDKVISSISDSLFQINESHINYRIISAFSGFPIGLPGEYLLKLSIKAADSDDAWQEVGGYPVAVQHIKAEKKTEPIKEPSEDVWYHVYRSTDPHLPKAQWTRLTDTPVPDTNFVDKSGTPNTTYYYYVTAINALGIESEPSEVISVTTPPETETS